MNTVCVSTCTHTCTHTHTHTHTITHACMHAHNHTRTHTNHSLTGTLVLFSTYLFSCPPLTYLLIHRLEGIVKQSRLRSLLSRYYVYDTFCTAQSIVLYVSQTGLDEPSLIRRLDQWPCYCSQWQHLNGPNLTGWTSAYKTYHVLQKWLYWLLQLVTTKTRSPCFFTACIGDGPYVWWISHFLQVRPTHTPFPCCLLQDWDSADDFHMSCS